MGETTRPAKKKQKARKKRRDLKFQVIVINRADAKDRLDFQTWQLDQMGIDFIRVDAFTPATLPSVRKSYWRKWRRPLKPTERARLLSHGLAWDWVYENGPALILEDDAVLARSIPDLLQNLEMISDIEYLSFEVRGRRKLLGKVSIPIGHGVSSHRLYLDRMGSAAYVLWPTGAQKLIRRASRGAVAMDGLAQWAKSVKCYQADPACAVQLDMAEEYGLSVPLRSESSTKTERLERSYSVPQSMRLLLAGAHKMWRLVRFGLVADRRKVQLRPEFFDV